MPRKKKEAVAPPTFEKALSRLEEIVARLETEELALEEALALFEEGTALGRRCNAQLDEAEQRITVLLERADGSVQERELDEVDEATPEPTGGKPRRRRSAPKASLFDEGEERGDDDDVPF